MHFYSVNRVKCNTKFNVRYFFAIFQSVFSLKIIMKTNKWIKNIVITQRAFAKHDFKVKLSFCTSIDLIAIMITINHVFLLCPVCLCLLMFLLFFLLEKIQTNYSIFLSVLFHTKKWSLFICWWCFFFFPNWHVFNFHTN